MDKDASSRQWWYESEGKPHGPVDFYTLEQLLKAGVVRRSSRIWRDGDAEWVALADHPAFSAGSTSPTGGPPPLDLRSVGAGAQQAAKPPLSARWKALREKPNFKVVATAGGGALTLLVFLLANVVGEGLGGVAGNRIVERQLANYIETQNEKLPVLLGNGTRAEKIGLKNHRVQFNYTITGDDAFGLRQTDVEAFFWKTLMPVACRDPFVIKALRADIPIDYKWQRRDGSIVGTMEVTPIVCDIVPR